MINECEAVGGMRISRETQILEKNPPQCLLPLKIPYYLTWNRILVTSMGYRRLTANTSNIFFHDKLIVAELFNQFSV
jgi:hypothetical protein